jgi:hypothetical protein
MIVMKGKDEATQLKKKVCKECVFWREREREGGRERDREMDGQEGHFLGMEIYLVRVTACVRFSFAILSPASKCSCRPQGGRVFTVVLSLGPSPHSAIALCRTLRAAASRRTIRQEQAFDDQGAFQGEDARPALDGGRRCRLYRSVPE